MTVGTKGVPPLTPPAPARSPYQLFWLLASVAAIVFLAVAANWEPGRGTVTVTPAGGTDGQAALQVVESVNDVRVPLNGRLTGTVLAIGVSSSAITGLGPELIIQSAQDPGGERPVGNWGSAISQGKCQSSGRTAYCDYGLNLGNWLRNRHGEFHYAIRPTTGPSSYIVATGKIEVHMFTPLSLKLLATIGVAVLGCARSVLALFRRTRWKWLRFLVDAIGAG